MTDSRYVEGRSITVEDVLATAASTDTIALATPGRVILLDSEGDTVVDLDEAPTALALGDVLVVASASRTTAYDQGGTVQWRAEVGPCTALTTAAGSGLVVGSNGEQLIGLDADSGEVRFRIPRPNADVATDHHLTSWGDEAVIAAWFSLSTIDADGDQRLDAQVDGAISHLGVVGDIAVVALQNDDVVGIDLNSGTPSWTDSLAVEWLADYGTDRVLARVEGELHAITDTGDAERIEDVGPGTPVVAATGTPLCLIDGGRVTVFDTPSEDLTIDATILSEAVRPDSKLEFRLVNRADSAATLTLDLQAEQTAIDVDAIDVAVPAGDETTVSFPVSDVDGSEVTLELTGRDLAFVNPTTVAEDDGSRLAAGETVELLTATLPVAQESSLVTDVVAESVHKGKARVSLTVENRGETPVRHVVVSSGDETIRAISPGESVTKSITVPLDGDVTVRARGEDPLTGSLDLSDPPLALSVSDDNPGFVDIEVENVAGVTVEDDIDIGVSGTPTLPTRSLHLEPAETVVFVIPVPQGGTHTVEVETSVATLSETIELPSSAETGTRPGHGTDAPAPPSTTNADQTAGEGSDTDRGADRAEDWRRSDSQTESFSDTPTDDTASTPATEGRKSDGEMEAGPSRAPEPGGTDSTSAPVGDAAPRTRRRMAGANETGSDEAETDLDSDEPTRRESPTGHHPERHEQPGTTADGNGDEHRSERADSADSDSGPGPVHTDESSVDLTDGTTDDEVRTESVVGNAARTPDRLAVDRTLDATEAFEGYAVVERLRIANGDETSSDVTLEYGDGEQRIEDIPAQGAIMATRFHVAYGVDEMTLDSVVVSDGESTDRTESVTMPVSRRDLTPWVILTPRDDATDATVHLQNDSNDACRVRQLRSRGFDRTLWFEDFVVSAGEGGRATDTFPGTPPANVLQTAVEIEHGADRSQHLTVGTVRETPPQTGLAVTIDAIETISERELNVTLLVENTGPRDVDVAIEAEGDVPDDYLYSAAHVSDLASGDSFVHRIECTLDRDRVVMPVSLAATVGSETVSERLTVCGPVDGTPDQWEIDRSSESRKAPEPGRISTSYRPENF